MGRAQCSCIGAGMTTFRTRCLAELGNCLGVLGINPNNSLNCYLLKEIYIFAQRPSDFW